ncbi:MAG: hypothetical protein KC766_03465, partial [Myxococcales bacterium]|nr:hypothetical protein [Myxococcales bacterium]
AEPGAAEPAPGVDPTPEGEPATKEPEAVVGDSEVEPPPAAVPQGDDSAVADARAGDSALELPGKTYYFVGLRYRTIIVPKFMINLFGDGGRTVVVHSGGPEFGIRKDGFEYNFGLWFANYAMDDTPFKSTSDGEKAWEIVNSKMKAIYITSDFLWSQEFSPAFSLNYGAGVGLGFMFGDLNRVQAYPRPGSAGNPEDFERCDSPNQDQDPGDFCGDDNDHYGDYNEPSWADGGSKPIVFPWLALQTGLRFKPAKSFVARLDLGFGTSGFFVGVGADYGL